MSDLWKDFSDSLGDLPLSGLFEPGKSVDVFVGYSQDHHVVPFANFGKRFVESAGASAALGLGGAESDEQWSGALDENGQRVGYVYPSCALAPNVDVDEAARAFGQRVGETVHGGGDAEYAYC